MKAKQTKWEVGDERFDDTEEDLDQFDSKKDALEYINQTARGKHFVIFKTEIKRKLVSKINLKRPRSCSGGWYGGHSISEKDKKNDTKNPFCTRCGYKLKIVERFASNPRLMAVKPLVHKEDLK